MSILDQPRRRPAPAPSTTVDPLALAEREPFVELLDGQDEFHADTLSSNGVHRVVLRGELDLIGAPILARKIRDVCAEPARSLRLDLRKLSFMDSSGLHVVLEARDLCARRGIEFVIAGATPPVRRVFEVSGLAALLRPQRP